MVDYIWTVRSGRKFPVLGRQCKIVPHGGHQSILNLAPVISLYLGIGLPCSVAAQAVSKKLYIYELGTEMSINIPEKEGFLH